MLTLIFWHNYCHIEYVISILVVTLNSKVWIIDYLLRLALEIIWI